MVPRKRVGEWAKGQTAAGATAPAAEAPCAPHDKGNESSARVGAARAAGMPHGQSGDACPVPPPEAHAVLAPRTEPPLTLKERQLERERRLAAAAAAAAAAGHADGGGCGPHPSALSQQSSAGSEGVGSGARTLGVGAQQANGRSRRLRAPDGADGDGWCGVGGCDHGFKSGTGLTYQQEALLAPLRELLQLGHLSAGVDPRFKSLGTLANGGVRIRESKTLELFGTKLGRGLFAGRDYAKDEPVCARARRAPSQGRSVHPPPLCLAPPLPPTPTPIARPHI